MAGLEIAVNLQEGGSQARIPQPWSWDVLVVGQAGGRVKDLGSRVWGSLFGGLWVFEFLGSIVWGWEFGFHGFGFRVRGTCSVVFGFRDIL